MAVCKGVDRESCIPYHANIHAPRLELVPYHLKKQNQDGGNTKIGMVAAAAAAAKEEQEQEEQEASQVRRVDDLRIPSSASRNAFRTFRSQ